MGNNNLKIVVPICIHPSLNTAYVFGKISPSFANLEIDFLFHFFFFAK